MNNSQTESYYGARRRKLLRGFDRVSKRLTRCLGCRYDAPFVATVVPETRREFSQLIPQIPYIGGWRNCFSPVMVISGWMIALHRAMKARGKSAAEVIQICVDVAEDFFGSFPGRSLKLMGRMAFAPPVKHVLKQQARRSQKRRYAADFVYDFREGNGEDFALEFEECAVNKFYEAQGAQELKPYCNFFDVTYSRFMEMGVNANETIGQGCRQCRLRFKQGRKTSVPEPLRSMIPEARESFRPEGASHESQGRY